MVESSTIWVYKEVNCEFAARVATWTSLLERDVEARKGEATQIQRATTDIRHISRCPFQYDKLGRLLYSFVVNWTSPTITLA